MQRISRFDSQSRGAQASALDMLRLRVLRDPRLEEMLGEIECLIRSPDGFILHSADGIPVGRIVIEWRPDGVTHGVDIAVLPEFRSSGAGLQMLRAWLDVADSMESLSTLYVRSDNPVLALYRRLGFRVSNPEAGADDAAFLRMFRISRRAAAAVAGKAPGV
jgi:ribosomal protein S18 acetylase RimI-like enzyme